MDRTIAASVRSETGKGAARQCRMAGDIPAVVYGPSDAPMSVRLKPAHLERLFRKTQDRNTIVDLDVDGNTIPVLVREVQRHPEMRDILHVDFYRVSHDKKVEVMIPVEGVGRPKGAVLGGRLRIIRRTLKARCDYDKIPSKFTVDVSPMEIGDMVKASEIATPEGTEVVFVNDFNVLTVYGKRVAK